MKKITFIGLLLFSVFAGTSVAQNIPYMTLIDREEMKYMDNSEISIADWNEYEFDMKNRFGADSPEFLSTIPDTLFFRKWYMYSYISAAKINTSYRYSKTDWEFKRNNYDRCPMIGVSHQQCVDYCRWRTERSRWNIKNIDKVEFSLPTEEDYKKAEQFAAKTNDPPLSKLKSRKRSGKIYGLSDNVTEYTLDNKLEYADTPVGFRCVAKIVR